jgi:hypothetical protein
MPYLMKKVPPADLEQAAEVMEDGRRFLKESGSSQWQHGLPSKELLAEDIAEGKLFGLYQDNLLVAICAFSLIPDPSYRVIYDGKWLTAGASYLTMHTFAFRSGFRGCGLSHLVFQEAERQAQIHHLSSIRGDTYKKNQVMQHVFIKEGFTRCGTILLVNEKIDNDRLAFEKIIGKEKKDGKEN